MLPAAGQSYQGAGGGTATISEVADPKRAGYTLRTVVYDNYVNEQGMVLNGTESSSQQANLNTIYYNADITVSGSHTGYLKADAQINSLQRTITGFMVDENGVTRSVTSSLDGDVLHLLDPVRYQETLAEQ